MGDMERKKVILPIIFSLILIGITANYAMAAIVVSVEGTIIDVDGDFYAWDLTGTTAATSMVVTNVCGNTSNPSEELDPILTVQSPAMMKFNDDGFTPCDNFASSIVLFDVTEVMDGCWVTNAAGFQGLGGEIGPYTLTLDLQGPGTIASLGLVNGLFDCPAAPVGGSDVSISTTSLLLAGVQSISMWMIPVVIAGAGIGVFVIKRRN